jgi:hypothetical protein
VSFFYFKKYRGDAAPASWLALGVEPGLRLDLDVVQGTPVFRGEKRAFVREEFKQTLKLRYKKIK